MTNTKEQISISGKDVFKIRIVKDNQELGCFLYDMFIELLELVGEEINRPSHELHNNQICWLRESFNGNERSRYFIVDSKMAAFIRFTIYNDLMNAINKFGIVNQNKGKNILMQLNNGELSAKDFSDNLK